MQVLKTPDGVRFGVLGDNPDAPSPTLFVLGGAMADALTAPNCIRSGRQLHRDHGFLCVSLDAPCEGAATRPGEPYGLNGWRHRVERGEDFTAAFCRDATSVLDDLIARGWTDPRRVGVLGISRGGFLGLHFAAADGRIRCLALMAPVTDLRTLRDFEGLADNELARSLAAVNHVDKLTGRAVWLMIGDRDERVGTDHSIGLARRLSGLAVEKGVEPRVFLYVVPANGHTNPDGSHDMAAPWIVSELSGP